jgi:hypothetical protein
MCRMGLYIENYDMKLYYPYDILYKIRIILLKLIERASG